MKWKEVRELFSNRFLLVSTLNIQPRLVYSVDEEQKKVTVLSVWSRYERGL